MKRHSPPKYIGVAKTRMPLRMNLIKKSLLFSVSICLYSSAYAAQTADKPLPGRLFYTPAQRTMLLDARAYKSPSIQKSPAPIVSVAPMRFDGVITRSDGVATHWINGRAHVGQPRLPDLKPGQTRAQQQVYEPYQLQHPSEMLPQPQIAPPSGNSESAP